MVLWMKRDLGSPTFLPSAKHTACLVGSGCLRYISATVLGGQGASVSISWVSIAPEGAHLPTAYPGLLSNILSFPQITKL